MCSHLAQATWCTVDSCAILENSTAYLKLQPLSAPQRRRFGDEPVTVLIRRLTSAPYTREPYSREKEVNLMNEIEAFANQADVAEGTLKVLRSISPVSCNIGSAVITAAQIGAAAALANAGQNCIQSPFCFGTSFIPPVALPSTPSFSELMDVRTVFVG